MGYYSLNDYATDKYKKKLYRLSIDGGFSCPNRDGKIGYGGCVFCNGSGSGSFTGDFSNRATSYDSASRTILPIHTQIDNQKAIINPKLPKTIPVGYVAYFQSFTGTYGDIEALKKIYLPVAQRDDIDVISIATRPDCITPEVLDFLDELNKIKPLWIELGLQTIHPQTASYIRRGYDLAVYDGAVKSLLKIGLDQVITHIILGLPNETPKMMLETLQHVIETGSNGIKFQLLHVLKGTDLETDYNNGLFSVLTLDEYTSILKSCISLLPSDMVVHRITGDGDKRELVAPLWSANKKMVLNHLRKELQ